MRRELEVPVLVVGAGPVGLTLAMDLAWRGVEVMVVEKRARGEPPPPKCNHVAARSMEIFRRLGLAARLRDAGLPADYPNDVSYRTAFTGRALTRIAIPCRRDRYSATGGPDTDWPTPEPPHRINQIFLEPILFAHAEAMAGVGIRTRALLESFTQSDEFVVAIARDLDDGAETRIRCRYLVGCDGGRSRIRRAIGARLEGDAVIQRVQSSYFRAPSLIALQRERPPGPPSRSTPGEAATSTPSTGGSAGSSTIISGRRRRRSMQSTATGRSAPFSASGLTSTMRSSPGRTGSAAAW